MKNAKRFILLALLCMLVCLVAGTAALADEIVVLDNSDCTFKITSIEPDSMWGYTWNVYLENKTEKKLMFSVDGASVNGIMCDPFWASSVTANAKSNESISWYSSKLESIGVTKVEQVEFSLRVYDADDWSAEDLVNQVCVVYPDGNTAWQMPARLAAEGDTVLVDNESIQAIVAGMSSEKDNGFVMSVYFLNKTDKELMFSIQDASVNGVMCDPYCALSIMPGKAAYEQVEWSGDQLTESGITLVRQLEFGLRAYDSNDWSADDYLNEVFTLYPQGSEGYTDDSRAARETDIVLFDNEYATMVVTGTGIDKIWGYQMYVYLINKTDKSLMFTSDDVTVNGYMCDPYWAESVAAGKQCYSTISWSNSTLEQNGITKVESIVMPLRVYDDSSWTGERFIDETFTITPVQ